MNQTKSLRLTVGLLAMLAFACGGKTSSGGWSKADAEQMCEKMAKCLEPQMKAMQEQLAQMPAEMKKNMPTADLFTKEKCMEKNHGEHVQKRDGKKLTDAEWNALKRCSTKIIAASCDELMNPNFMQGSECQEWTNIAKDMAP